MFQASSEIISTSLYLQLNCLIVDQNASAHGNALCVL